MGPRKTDLVWNEGIRGAKRKGGKLSFTVGISRNSSLVCKPQQHMGQVVGLDHHLDWKLEHIIISYAMYFQSLSNTKSLRIPTPYLDMMNSWLSE